MIAEKSGLDSFQKFLVFSAIMHSSIFFMYGIKTLVFPTKTIIIPSSIRVDVVDLPDKSNDMAIAEAPSSSTPEVQKETPKVEPKEVPAVKPKNPLDDQKRALEKIKQLAALDKIKGDLNQKPPTKNSGKSDTLKKNLPTFKGNQITSGNSFTGIAGIASQEYWDTVKLHLQNHWALPEWLANAKLKASAVVMIDVNGRVRRSEIYQSSGNPAFDEATLAAVEAASPFPVPPDKIKDTITDSWMIFNFPD